MKPDRITSRYKEARADILPVDNPKAFLDEALRACRVARAYRDEAGDSVTLLCRDGKRVSIEQIVFKSDPKGGSVAVKITARKSAHLKALALAAASVEPIGKKGRNEAAPTTLPLREWRPADGSFLIDIPEGWQATGGTADLGGNGYLRIVQVRSPDGKASFVGFYYPFYQYAQTPYGANGIPPMEGVPYVRDYLFRELAGRFGIGYENLRFDRLEADRRLSERLSAMNADFYRLYGLSVRVKIEWLMGHGSFTEGGAPRELLVVGMMQYQTFPLQGGMGYQYAWGPAPLFVETAPKGALYRYHPTFRKMADSFRVSPAWLQSHMQNAYAQQRQILAHYRKMRDIIHRGSERRIAEALRFHESEENEKMEEFWDTFYALGGEARYDHPDTGEEIDLPIGADRYFYDRFSRTWVGLKNDDPDMHEWVQHLKEEGYRELRPHTH